MSTVHSSLRSVLQELDAHDTVSLPGSRSAPVVRWCRRSSGVFRTCLGIIALGVVAIIGGLLLRDSGGWGVLVPVGIFLTFVATVAVGAVALNSRLMSDRLRAEVQAVVLGGDGITLRGIGPIPWSDVGAPERRHVRVKNDIGGLCSVMPLTHQGHERVRRQPDWWRHRVGPKPYLRFDVPYLLLPGIENLTEDEIFQLFQIAQQRFSGDAISR